MSNNAGFDVFVHPMKSSTVVRRHIAANPGVESYPLSDIVAQQVVQLLS